MLACMRGSPELVSMLLLHGADPNCVRNQVEPSTCLLLACSQTQSAVALARLLLDAGAHVNAKGGIAGTTPLVVACASGSAQLVALLLERGANMTEERTSDGATPFSVAYANNHFGIIRQLLAYNSRVCVSMGNDNNSQTILSIIDSILAAKPLALLGTAGSDLFRVIISRLDFTSTDPSDRYYALLSALHTLLGLASSSGDVELVTALVQHVSPQSIKSRGPSALLAASRGGHVGAMRVLLANGANPLIFSEDLEPPLHACIARNNVEAVKLLVLSPVTFSAVASGRMTPPVAPTGAASEILCSSLSLALSSKGTNEKIIHLLLSAGANAPELDLLAMRNLHFRDLSAISLNDIEANTLLVHFPRSTSVSLNLSDNCIVQLPHPSAWLYPALVTLKLARNNLRDLPRGLHLLTSLTYLDVCSNAISDLRPLVADRPSRLKVLLVCGNPLAHLPLRLHTLESLQTFEFDVAPHLGVPEVIQKMPTAELLGFLRAVEHKSVKWSSIKLILVGQENVGKTSLAQLLTSESLQPNILSTNGIAISELSSPHDQPWRYYCASCFEYFEADSLGKKKEQPRSPSSSISGRLLPHDRSLNKSSSSSLRTPPLLACPACTKGVLLPDTLSISIWDFGGQEVFYPTHSLFLVRTTRLSAFIFIILYFTRDKEKKEERKKRKRKKPKHHLSLLCFFCFVVFRAIGRFICLCLIVSPILKIQLRVWSIGCGRSMLWLEVAHLFSWLVLTEISVRNSRCHLR